MKNALKNFSASVIAIFLLVGTAVANDKQTSPVEFRYVGNVERHPVYQLNINGQDSEEYYISFSDQAGNVLYSSNTKGGKFMINVDEVGNEVITVTISSRRGNKQHVYTIKRSQNVVEENVITRIK